MELIAQLELSFARPVTGSRPPRNLREFSALLGQLRPGPEVAEFSRLWAQELERIRRDEAASLGKKRGSLRRLWAEQNLIYEDLLGVLQQAAHQIEGHHFLALRQTAETFAELLDELGDSLQDLGDWHQSAHPRCLACSWDGEAERCPHCDLRLLVPVRQAQPAAAPLALAPHHQALLDRVVSVVQGSQDVESLAEPLESLQADFYQAAVDARAHPELELVAELLEAAFVGLTKMTQTLEDSDCQHLEDGWNLFFHTQLALAEALAEGDSEQLHFSRD